MMIVVVDDASLFPCTVCPYVEIDGNHAAPVHGCDVVG
jgi:hypothetical protein